ncbi:zinc ribbon domain-containing protein [Lachnospiraceae bacterium 48-33]
MALIKCSECGGEISDKAKKCIHCGKVFVEETPVKEEIKCSECGEILTETAEICPNCGCPVEKFKNDEVKPQQVEVASVKITKKTKKIIIGVVIAIILCTVGGVGYKIYSNKKAEQEYQGTYNEYISNLEKVQVLMLSGGGDSESLCNLTLKVWGNAISKEKDSETDKYTQKDRYTWNDFNTALANLYADSSTSRKVSNIESNQSSVKDLIKKLQNPPKGLDKCYDTVSDLYESYKKLTDLAINPSGSYRDFGQNKSNAVSDFMATFEKLDNQIPDKIKTE